MVTPIIATIKNIIDKDKEKIGNTSKYIDHSVQYQTSRENIDTNRTEDIFDAQNPSSGTSTSTTEDINRKF